MRYTKVLTDNARYTKLRGEFYPRNWNGSQCCFQLKVFNARSLAFEIEKHAHAIDLKQILIDEIGVPVGLYADACAKIGANHITFGRQKPLRNVNDAPRGLFWTSARFFNNDVAYSQSVVRIGPRRDVPWGNSRKIMRRNRRNVCSAYAKNRLRGGRACGLFPPISADELGDYVEQIFHSHIS